MNTKLLNVLLLLTIIFGQVEPIVMNAAQISEKDTQKSTKADATAAKKAKADAEKAQKLADEKTISEVLGFGKEKKEESKKNSKSKKIKVTTKAIPQKKVESLEGLRNATAFNLITNKYIRPGASGTKYTPYHSGAQSANYKIPAGSVIKPGELVMDFPKMLTSRYTNKKFDLKITFIMNTASPAEIDLGVNTYSGLTIGYKVGDIKQTIPLRAEYEIYDSDTGKKINSAASMFIMDNLGSTYSTSLNEDAAEAIVTTNKTTTQLMKTINVDGKPLEFYWGTTSRDITDNGSLVAVNTSADKNGIPILAVQSNRFLADMLYTAYFSVGGSLSVTNVDKITKEPIKGAKYELLFNGELKDTYTTNSSGGFDMYLDEGDYILRQISVPDGYVLDSTPQKVAITANERTTLDLTTKHEGEKVIIHNIDNQSPASNVSNNKFKIVDSQNKTVAENLTTGTDGKVESDWLPKGKYKLVQTDYEEEKYLKAEDIEFEIKTDSTGVKDILKPVNKSSGTFNLKLVDYYDNTKGLDKGIFALTKDGANIDTIVTKSDGTATIHLEPGTYQLKQLISPSNYIKDTATYSIVINKEKEISKTIINEPVLGKLKLHARDENNQYLANMTYKVTGPFGYNEVFTVNSGTSQNIADLVPGEYTIRVLSAPDKYAISDENQEIKKTIAPGGDVDAYFDFNKFDKTKDALIVAQDAEVNVKDVPTTQKQLIELVKAKALDVDGTDLTGDIKLENDNKLLGTSTTGDYDVTVSVKGKNGKVTMRNVKIKVIANTAKTKSLNVNLNSSVSVDIGSNETAQQVSDNKIKPKVQEVINDVSSEPYSITSIKETNYVNNTVGTYFIEYDVVGKQSGLHATAFAKVRVSDDPKVTIDYNNTEYTESNSSVEIGKEDPFKYVLKGAQVPKSVANRKIVIDVPNGVSSSDIKINVEGKAKDFGQFQPSQAYTAVYNASTKQYTITLNANGILDMVYNVSVDFKTESDFVKGMTADLKSTYNGNDLTEYKLIGDWEKINFTPNAKQQILIEDEVFDPATKMEAGESFNYQVYNLVMPKSSKQQDAKLTMFNLGNLRTDGAITVDYKNDKTAGEYIPAPTSDYQVMHTDGLSTVTIKTSSTPVETTYRVNVPYATKSTFYGGASTTLLSIIEHHYTDLSLTQELPKYDLQSSDNEPDFLVMADKDLRVENAWVSAKNYSFVQLKGSKQVYATGVNKYGELGTGDKVTKTSYVPVIFNPALPDDEYVIDIDVAEECTLALTNKGNIYFTGVSHYNQRINYISALDDNSGTREQKFSKLNAPEKIKKIGLTKNTTFYLGESGKLYGSGRNNTNAISDGSAMSNVSNGVVAQNVSDFTIEGTVGAYSTYTTVYFKSGGTWYARGWDQQGQTATSVMYVAVPQSIKQKPVLKPDGKQVKNIYPSVTSVLLETEDGLLYGQGNVTSLGGHNSGLDKKAQVPLQKVKFWRKNDAGKTVDVTNNDLTVKKVHSSWAGTMVELSDGSFWYSGNNETEGSTGGTQIGTGINDPYTFVELSNISNSGLEAYRNSADGKGTSIAFANGVQKFQAGENNAFYIDNDGFIRTVTKDAAAFGSTALSGKPSLELKQWNLLKGIIQINENKKMTLSNASNNNIEGDINGEEKDLPTNVIIDNPYLIDRDLSNSTTDAYWPYAHIDIKDQDGNVVNSSDVAVQDKKAVNYSIPSNVLTTNKEYTITTYFHTKNIDSKSNDYRKSNGLSKTFKVEKAKALVHYYGEDYYDEVTVEPAEYFTYEIRGLEYKDENKMRIEYTFPNDVKFLNDSFWEATKVYKRPLGSNDEFVLEEGGNRGCNANTCYVDIESWMGKNLEVKLMVHAFTDYSFEPGKKAPITAQVSHDSAIENINTVNIVRAVDSRDPLEPYPYFMYDEKRYHPNLEVEPGKSFVYNIDNINVDNSTYGGGRNVIVPIPKYLELDTSVIELYSRPMGSWGAYERVWWPAPIVAGDNIVFPLEKKGTSLEYRVRIKFKASNDFPDATKTYLRPYIEYDDSTMVNKKIEESIVYTKGANLDDKPVIENTDAQVYTSREMTGTKQYPVRMGSYPGEKVEYVSENINVPDVSDLTGIEFLLKMTDNTNLATFANKIKSNEVIVEKTTDNGSTYTQIDSKNIEITYPNNKEINVKINDTFSKDTKYRVKFTGSMITDPLSTDGLNLNGFVKYVQGTETTSFEMKSINIYGQKPFGVEVETTMGNEIISIDSTDPLIYNHDIKYQYRITNCSTCGDWSDYQPVTDGKINVPISDLNDITGRTDNKFNDFENIELRLTVDGLKIPTTTVRRWYPAKVSGTVTEINNQVNPVAEITTYDLGINNFGTIEHNYGIETYVRKALTSQTVTDGKIRVSNALTVTTSVPETREVPSSWEGIDKSELTNVDLSDDYQDKAKFKLLLPSRFLDPTFEESTTTIGGNEFKAVNFNLTDYLTATPKLQVLDQYVVEKFSGRVYNKDYGTLSDETDEPYAIMDGQNDARDIDLTISNTLSSQFLINPDLKDLHVSGKVYYQYEDYGLNKVSYQVSRQVSNNKEMFGYFKRDAKYYFINSRASDAVRLCLTKNECDEVTSQEILYEGRVKKGNLIKQQITSNHGKLNSYKGVNEWIDPYVE